MIRKRCLYIDGKAHWVDVRDLRNLAELHYVQSDEIPPTVSYADNRGLVFTSKRKLFEHYKEVGVECTGGDHFTGKGMADVNYQSLVNQEEMHEASKQEINKAKWGMMPCSDREKQLWIEESRAMKGQSSNREYLLRMFGKRD